MASGSQPAFGRRAVAAPSPRPRPKAAEPAAPQPAPVSTARPDHDPELEDWKRARVWHPPWRQISLMASLCFGVASLVLPDTVNDAVNWLFYALAAASLYGGLRKRRG